MESTVAQIISTVGFPIAACVFTGYFCKYLVDKYTTIITETMQKLSNAIDELNEKIDDILRNN